MTTSAPTPCFAILTPDAVHRHVERPAVDMMTARGFRVVGFRIVEADPEDVDALYSINVSDAWFSQVWQSYRFRCNDDLFTLGPAIAMWLWHPADGDGGHRRLKALKGSSYPEAVSAGTIRGDLRAVNSVLSLLHSSDDAAESVEEGSIFLGAGSYDAARAVAVAERPADVLADLRAACALLDRRAPAERRRHADVVAGLRADVLVSCAARAVDPTPLYRAADAVVAGEPVAVVPALSGLPDAARELLRCRFDGTDDGVTMGRVRRAAAAVGVRLDPWADLVLGTSLHFPPLPDVTAAGDRLVSAP